jgi:hypothetical protein
MYSDVLALASLTCEQDNSGSGRLLLFADCSSTSRFWKCEWKVYLMGAVRVVFVYSYDDIDFCLIDLPSHDNKEGFVRIFENAVCFVNPYFRRILVKMDSDIVTEFIFVFL